MENNSSRGMLEKGIGLLLAVGDHPEGAGVSELARNTGLAVSTVHRLLGTLVSLGFVRLEEGSRRYTLGLGVFELAHRVSLARGLSEVALPVMRRLVKATGEPSLLAVADGPEIVYVERIEGWRRIQIRGSVGERGPIYCTSLGKALLAFMPEEEREDLLNQIEFERLAPNTITDRSRLREELELTRERGYAVADEEREEDVRAVGVPVLGPRGGPVASLCLAVPVFRVAREELEEYVPMLREAATEIGVQLPRGNVVEAARPKEG